MTATQLKEYVKYAYDIESSIFQQEQLLEKLQNEKRQLPAPASKPVAVPQRESSVGGPVLKVVGVSIFALGILLIISLFVSGLADGGGGFGEVLIVGGLACLICYGLICLGCRIYDFGGKVSKDKENAFDSNYSNYISQLNAYNSYQNSRPLARTLDVEIDALQKKLSQSRAVMRNIYSYNVIYPKYRNLIAVSSFYDYLMSGRCDTLEGHEGAYNIFETESRLDKIITQLDTVIAHLEQIQRNQYMLYNAIQDSNRQTQQLYLAVERSAQELARSNQLAAESNAQLGSIRRCAELTAYEAERTRKEIEVQHWLERQHWN